MRRSEPSVRFGGQISCKIGNESEVHVHSDTYAQVFGAEKYKDDDVDFWFVITFELLYEWRINVGVTRSNMWLKGIRMLRNTCESWRIQLYPGPELRCEYRNEGHEIRGV